MLDRIIFGDNQFFGINHMSEEKEQALAERFRTLQSITDVIEIAYDAGIRAFMLNTNERAREICDYWRANASQYKDLVLYPSLPYAHKYAALVNEKGIFSAIKETILADASTAELFGMMTKGGVSLFDKDMVKIMQMLIDIELKIFRGLNVKVIFLQNIVTDLLLGYGVKEIFCAYCDYIKEKYQAEPGFVTQNTPRLVEFLLECGIENPIVCSSTNKAGYLMNPDKASYEQTIREKPYRPIAMSILASGAVKPEEAVRYICDQPEIQSIVFGASSKQHIIETKELIERYSCVAA